MLRFLLGGVVGGVVVLVVAIGLIYAFPRVYMGGGFKRTAMTQAEVITTLKYGQSIHGFYANLPRLQVAIFGSREFHQSWINTYDWTIRYLEESR